jgi:myo-inositol-1(or 4)-monophosphatase
MAPRSALLDTAHALADLAGATVLRHFRRRPAIENKAAQPGGFDPVTEADKAAERAMRRELSRRHPDHGIVGEEFDEEAGSSDYRWVLDPIDGTRAFMVGFPVWGTLIGLVEEQTPVIGLMDQPFTRERYFGVAGGTGARMRTPDGHEQRLRTTTDKPLSEALLSATTPEMFKGVEARRFKDLAGRVRMTRYGGDCYAYCMLAAGHLDLVVEAGLKAVDIVPLIPIIEGAGGIVTSWTGGSPLKGGRILAAGDQRLHAEALKILAE